jgi:hypothetical protein
MNPIERDGVAASLWKLIRAVAWGAFVLFVLVPLLTIAWLFIIAGLVVLSRGL